MGLDYAREKFYIAIDTLATSPSPIQERLFYAAMSLIRLRPEDDLPKELRKEFQAIIHELSKEPAIADEGTLAATTRKLSDDDAKKLAERILSIYIELRGGI